MHVDRHCVGLANRAQSLEDVAVLHLKNGRDYFLTIHGDFEKSAFGRSLEELTAASPFTNSSALQLPAEIWRLVDELQAHVENTESLFLESGDDMEMEEIRLALAEGQEFTCCSGHSIAHTLITFLDSLPDPIIPEAVSHQMDASPVDTSLTEQQRILGMLPTLNYNVFIYIMSFLRLALEYSSSNFLRADDLAVVFGNALTNKSKGSVTEDLGGLASPTSRSASKSGTTQFLLRFL